MWTSGRIACDSRLLAVASGKGGAGTTASAVNLASALDSSSMGIVDADLHGPNVPLALGVSGPDPEQSRGYT